MKRAGYLLPAVAAVDNLALAFWNASRGRYWNNARRCRSAYRNENEPDNRNRNLGFRLAAAHPPAEPVTDPTRVARGYEACARVSVSRRK